MIRIAPLNSPVGFGLATASNVLGVVFGALCGLTSALSAFADEAAPSVHASGDVLVTKLQAVQPELPIKSVRETDLVGVLALELSDGNVLYGTADARFLFTGDMYAIGSEGFVNLTDSIRAERRLELLDGLRAEDAIVFSPVGERKAYVNVFTDVDCGYCRKLHREIAEINALGIEVRYLAFPRAGKGSDSYHKIVSAWCAKDPHRAITELKMGETIPRRTCENPVAAQMDLAMQLGVTGTPALLTANGHLIPGYMPAANLAEALGL